jgi:hypothetical protein
MKKVILFTTVILCCAACNNEIAPPAEPEEAPQQIELSIPGAEEVSVYSAATVSECMIDTLWVVVFDGTTQAKRWAEMIVGSRIINNGQATQLLPQLKHKINNGDRVICMANVHNRDTTNVTPDNIDDCFSIKDHPNRYYFGGDYLPMYGEIKSWSAAGANACRMIRAVAKIQVRWGTSIEFDGGKLPSMFRVFHLAGGYIQPKSHPAGKISNISYTTGGVFYILQIENATERQKTLYIYEYQSSIHKINDPVTTIDIKEFHFERPCIILVDNGYYRLDFYNHATSEYLDIKRNHHYLFTINKIRSGGYATLEEARVNPPSNIEYTVQVDDDSQSVTSNGQYAVVTNVDTVRIAGDITSPQTVATFRYINPTEVELSTTIVTDTIYVEPGSVKPSGATLAITEPLPALNGKPITKSNRQLKIQTSGNLTEAVLILWFGNIKHRLPVKKVPN